MSASFQSKYLKAVQSRGRPSTLNHIHLLFRSTFVATEIGNYTYSDMNFQTVTYAEYPLPVEQVNR